MEPIWGFLIYVLVVFIVSVVVGKRTSALDAVVMRFSAKGQGNGFALRQEKTRYFLHSEWLYHASA